MKRIAIEGCQWNIQELVQMAKVEPIVLTRKGIPVAGIIKIDKADMEAWSLGSNPDFIAMIEGFRERGRCEGRIPLAEVRRRFEKEKGNAHRAKDIKHTAKRKGQRA